MEEKVKEIIFIPSIYLGVRDDGHVLLRCLQGETTVKRAFEPKHFKNMIDPEFIMLGVKLGENTMEISVKEVSEFEDLFHEKWSVLFDDNKEINEKKDSE